MDRALLKLFKAVQTPLVRFNEPMTRQTTFRIGGPAQVFIVPQTLAQLQATYNLCCQYKTAVYILGAGSNLLVNDNGIRDVVIKIVNKELVIDKNIITVGAGYPLGLLITKAARAGLSGLEPLVGIPGTVGGAVAMNAGGKYGNIADNVDSLVILDKKGVIKTLRMSEIKFGYRASSILRNGQIIWAVKLRLTKRLRAGIRKRMAKILSEKRASQPLAAWSAGCVFKNPAGQTAGALIDQAGLKGRQIGGAMVSLKHANFIVNTGRAKASHIKRLINLVKTTIHKKYKIGLETEIEIW